jgi:hypothetical protein
MRRHGPAVEIAHIQEVRVMFEEALRVLQSPEPQNAQPGRIHKEDIAARIRDGQPLRHALHDGVELLGLELLGLDARHGLAQHSRLQPGQRRCGRRSGRPGQRRCGRLMGRGLAAVQEAADVGLADAPRAPGLRGRQAAATAECFHRVRVQLQQPGHLLHGQHGRQCIPIGRLWQGRLPHNAARLNR